jgi:hypothetical protein
VIDFRFGIQSLIIMASSYAWRYWAEQTLRSQNRDLQKLITFCTNNSLLCQFPPSSQIIMSKEMKIIDYGKNSILFNQGDTIDDEYFYIVLKGQLVVYTSSEYELQRKDNESITDWWIKHGGTLDNINYGHIVGYVQRGKLKVFNCF